MSDTEIKMTDQLWELSLEQAQEVLDAFLKTEKAAFETLVIPTVDLDYTLESVTGLAHFVADEIKAHRLDEEQQKLWFVRLGYYLGESLRRANPSLAWGLGDPEYAFANHPVVTGFADNQEEPVITICRNMIQAVVEGLSPPIRIDNGIRTCFGKPV